MAEYVAVALTIPQARELREAARRWYLVKTMREGGGRDMNAARAVRHGIDALDAVLGTSSWTSSWTPDPAVPAADLPEGEHHDERLQASEPDPHNDVRGHPGHS